MSTAVTERMMSIAQMIERQLDDVMTPLVLGEGLQTWSKKVSPSGEKVTVGALVHLALLNDALVIAERAVMHDNVVTVEEKAYLTPLAQTAVRYLVHFRRAYEEFTSGLDDVKDFLDTHMNDSQPFGGRSVDTRWTGAHICRNLARNGDDGPLVDYRETMVRLVDDIFELTKDVDRAGQKQLREEIANHSQLEQRDTKDGRAAAFLSATSGSVFHAVAHAEEVFEQDPLDVEAIHAEARDVFVRTLERVSAVHRRSRHGAMLLIQGESGAGKTHLMRAFRAHVHEARLGYVGYLQMTSASGAYARHILTSLIDSLERPFLAGEPSSLTCIAEALMRWRVPSELAAKLRAEDADPSERAQVVGQIVDHLVAQREFTTIDVDLIRAFVYLASNDGVVGARVKRYLRCDGLSDYDRQHLGGISPQTDDNAPLRMIIGIGKLIAASHGGALVLLVDQLEDVYEVDAAQHRFRNLMDALRQVTEMVPTSLAVVACLDDFYEKLRNGLSRTLLDRLEQDPTPVHIVAPRTREEVELLLAARLRLLFDLQGARVRDSEPLWPFEPASIAALAGLRTRDVLDWCRTAHERCIAAGKIELSVAPPAVTSVTPASPKPFASEWTQHFASFPAPAPADDELMRIIAWGIEEAARETDLTVAIATKNGLEIAVGSTASAKKIVPALCNAGTGRGALAKQIDSAAEQAEKCGARLVIVRCTDFPSSATSKIAKQIGGILKKGGTKVVARDSDWRLLAALREFINKHGSSPELVSWLREERLAARLDLIKAILGDELPSAKRTASMPPPAIAPAPAPSSGTSPSTSLPPSKETSAIASASKAPLSSPRADVVGGPISLGRTRSLSPTDVAREPASFMRHAAFLGSTGSGKTTLALNVVEQCLLRGVPVLLVDRKGDLCRYGSEQFWNECEADESRAERKRALRERVKVQIFTPGEHRGRPLSLPIIPPGLSELETTERIAMAASAAAGLGSMMGYRSSQQDSARQAILTKAIEVLGQLSGKAAPELPSLIDLIADEDPTLVDAIGKLDTKHFKALVDHLETLRIRHEPLLRGGEVLNAELLFGMGPFATPGKAALSIVSTKFLPDAGVVDFWVSRLLIELTRWSSRHPSSQLQAIVMLDEADIYLPAQTKPATKQPMQDLLKRARSAGVGVFLATQSPGDLDYRCRDNIGTWFVGKVSEKTALDKMKPLLSDYRSNPVGKLAGAHTGEFFVLSEGSVAELKAERSLMNTAQLGEDEIIAASRTVG